VFSQEAKGIRRRKSASKEMANEGIRINIRAYGHHARHAAALNSY